MGPFLVGLQFLTRIHLRKETEWSDENFGKSVKWFPLIGGVLGLCLCALCFLLETVHAPLLTAFLLVCAEIFLTGALHIDGLTDAADGLFSGRSRERALAIMKDSLIGSFGMTAFVLLVGLKTTALASAGEDLYMILIAMPVIARFNMVVSICEYPYAREQGFGKSFATYRDAYAVPFAFVTALLPALWFGFPYLILAGVGILTGLFLNRWIVSKIGGTTGDTYGFVTEVTEAVLALVFVLLTGGVA